MFVFIIFKRERSRGSGIQVTDDGVKKLIGSIRKTSRINVYININIADEQHAAGNRP